MTVGELKKALDNYPDDTRVYSWDDEYTAPSDCEVEVVKIKPWSYTVNELGGGVREHAFPAGICIR